MGFYTLIVVLGATLCCIYAQSTSTPCEIDGKDICPTNHCCAVDEYLLSLVYCKPFGGLGDPCVTRAHSFGCPCLPDYVCVSHHTTTSHDVLYGTCREKTPANLAAAAAMMANDEDNSQNDETSEEKSLLSVILPSR